MRSKTVKPRTTPPQAARSKTMRWAVAVAVVVAGAVVYAMFRPSPAAPDSISASQENPAPDANTAFAPTIPNPTPLPSPAPEGMVWIPGGEFSMGSTAESEAMCSLSGVTRDALPVHRVYVDGFWMDATEVTNEQFEKFVKATGYVTIAERAPTKEEFPTAPPENLVAGSTGGFKQYFAHAIPEVERIVADLRKQPLQPRRRM